MNYTEAVSFLQSFPDAERGTRGAKAPTMSVEGMKILLARLGNPQTAARTIHVTGSKGKGSTATFIAAQLKEAGYRTALYTSPHLHSYCERIAFDLQPISETEFGQGLTAVYDAIQQQGAGDIGPISTFGVLTALFFHLSQSRSPAVQWQVVEVGMGGTDDATNVFTSKEMAIITAISLEHTAILGKTVAEIVANKAGIITPGCLTVLAPQRDPVVRPIVQEVCNRLNSELLDVSTITSFTDLAQGLDGQTFSLDQSPEPEVFSIKLLGHHQIENAVTSLAALTALEGRGLVASPSAIRKGLARAVLPGRFEILSVRQPSLDNGNSGAQMIVLDGAHNHDSARALSATLAAVFPSRKCIFVLGVNQDKQVELIWEHLSPHSKKLIATCSANMRSMLPKDIVARLSQSGTLAASTNNSVAEALQEAIAFAANDDLICVTGSLYVVAEAREFIMRSQSLKPVSSNSQ